MLAIRRDTGQVQQGAENLVLSGCESDAQSVDSFKPNHMLD